MLVIIFCDPLMFVHIHTYQGAKSLSYELCPVSTDYVIFLRFSRENKQIYTEG